MQNDAPLAKTALANFADTIYRCADCSYCVDAVWEERELNHVCPTLSHHSPALSYSGRGYMSIARALYEGEEFPLEDVAERVYTCTSCGNCARVCPIGLSPRDVNLALRETLAAQGAAPAAAQSYAAQLAEPSNKNLEARLAKLAPHEPEPTLDVANTLFLPGCETPDCAPGEVAACFSIIKDITKNPTVIEAAVGEPAACCGDKLETLGLPGQASATGTRLEAQTAVFPRLERIIHLNDKCAGRYADDSRHTSFTRWLVSSLDERQVRFASIRPPERMVCVSTCEEKSELVKLFALLNIKPLNTDFAANFAMCCGAGGGLPVIAAESARRMANAKLTNLNPILDEDTVVVVPNANCLAHLRTSIDNTSGAKYTLYGLGEYLDEHFKFSGAG